MSKNMVESDDNITRRMRFARRVTNAADKHSECLTFIAFARQRWLRERTSILRYTNFTSSVFLPLFGNTFLNAWPANTLRI
jgi:hypothetical protein